MEVIHNYSKVEERRKSRKFVNGDDLPRFLDDDGENKARAAFGWFYALGKRLQCPNLCDK